jgi:hypothetical protein
MELNAICHCSGLPTPRERPSGSRYMICQLTILKDTWRTSVLGSKRSCGSLNALQDVFTSPCRRPISQWPHPPETWSILASVWMRWLPQPSPMLPATECQSLAARLVDHTVPSLSCFRPRRNETRKNDCAPFR